MLKKVSMGHQNILTLVDYFETMNNCACFFFFINFKIISNRTELTIVF